MSNNNSPQLTINRVNSDLVADLKAAGYAPEATFRGYQGAVTLHRNKQRQTLLVLHDGSESTLFQPGYSVLEIKRSAFDDLQFAKAGDAEIVFVDDDQHVESIADLQAGFARLRVENDELIADCDAAIQRIDSL